MSSYIGSCVHLLLCYHSQVPLSLLKLFLSYMILFLWWLLIFLGRRLMPPIMVPRMIQQCLSHHRSTKWGWEPTIGPGCCCGKEPKDRGTLLSRWCPSAECWVMLISNVFFVCNSITGRCGKMYQQILHINGAFISPVADWNLAMVCWSSIKQIMLDQWGTDG